MTGYWSKIENGFLKMNELEVLRVKIYQPQAHFRIPFTYQRRHTYPIPPYSTFIGLLCNILGIRNDKGKGEPCENSNCNCDYHNLKKLKISICGRFESKTTEYIWFRNLRKNSHEERFASYKNRYVSGHIEHIGGQMPVPIDVLNDVKLWFYLYHEDKEFLEKIGENFKSPTSRIYPLHLGRAEDWIVIEDVKFTKLTKKRILYGDVFSWIPERIYFDGNFNFKRVSGLLYKLPTFYAKVDGKRNFKYENVKLNDGVIKDVEFYYDSEEEKPVFLLNNAG